MFGFRENRRKEENDETLISVFYAGLVKGGFIFLFHKFRLCFGLFS